MATSISDIEKLVDLFRTAENQLDDEEDTINNTEPDKTNIKCSPNENKNKPSDLAKKKQTPYAKIEPPERREILDPEADNADELYFDETSANDSAKSWKSTPKWDISYRQSVSASDVFLGMSFKNTSTSSCENMIVTVLLPGENRQNVDLKIDKDSMTLTSPKFFLDLKLPHPVDPKRGNAQFDKDEEKLIINLIMDRELDLLNF